MAEENIRIKGYHGTLRNYAQRIQREGFHPSNKESEWLGYGVYFFEEFEYAKVWANQQLNKVRREGKLSSPPVVLAVDISVPPNGMLDLDKYEEMVAFEEELQDAIEHIFGSGGAPVFDDERIARCYFCNLYTSIHSEIKVIAFSFPRIYHNTLGFPLAYFQRQLCVVDDTCIQITTSRLEAV